jgi:uncharacterized protein YegJ (DUF2314 family)
MLAAMRWLLVMFVAAACRRSPPEPARAVVSRAEPAQPSPAAVVPPGALFAERAEYAFIVYHLSRPARPPAALARQLLTRVGFQVAEKLPPEGAPKKPMALIMEPPLSEVGTPPEEELRYRGHGLSGEAGRRLQHPNSVTLMAFVAGADRLRSYHAALGAVRELAQKTDGVVVDAATRATWSAEAFAKLLEGWSGDVPDVRNHVTLDFYREEALGRIVSLGMEKLGLPDVAVTGVSIHESDAMSNLVNVALQTVIEGGAVGRDGKLELSLKDLRNESMKKSMVGSLKKSATGTATVQLVIARPRQGDAENRLLELAFPGPAESLQIRQMQLLSQFFGAEDSLIHARDDDEELLAASRRAKAKLAKLKPRFSPKPPELEHLMVKASFTTPSGGVEWMWVEVVHWRGKKIEGILQNDPYEVKDLKAGAHVEVDEDGLFDYLHQHDGTVDGNETGKILERK